MQRLIIAAIIILVTATIIKADEWSELANVTGKMNYVAMAAIKCQTEIQLHNKVGEDCQAMFKAYEKAGEAKDSLFTPDRMAIMKEGNSIEHKMALQDYNTATNQAANELNKALGMIEMTK